MARSDSERDAVREQLPDLEDALRERGKIVSRRDFVETYFDAIAPKTPPDLHDLLRGFLQRVEVVDDDYCEILTCLNGFSELGLVRAFLRCYPSLGSDDDPWEYKRRTFERGMRELLGERVVSYALTHEEDDHFRELAFRYTAEDFVESREAAVALLAQAGRWGYDAVAYYLAADFPDLPGIFEGLVRSLDRYRHGIAAPAHDRDRYNVDYSVGNVARLLAGYGERARPVLPRLEEIALDCDSDAIGPGDRYEVAAAFLRLCDDEQELARFADAVLAAGTMTDADLARCAAEWEGESIPTPLLAALSRHVRCRPWAGVWDSLHAIEDWNRTLDRLTARGRDSEIVLPALAEALRRHDVAEDNCHVHHRSRGAYRVRAVAAVGDFLRRLGWDGPAPRSAEDGFVLALRGAAAGDFMWLVYADWLEERGDPRHELVRARHALAAPGGDGRAEWRARRDEWAAAHGPGWDALYDLVARPPDSQGGANSSTETR